MQMVARQLLVYCHKDAPATHGQFLGIEHL
jgi:hypothetical protein